MKAERILPDVRICARKQIDDNLGAVRFAVQGSTGNFYIVVFFEDYADQTHSSCNCAAGRKDVCCYHIVAAWNLYSGFVMSHSMPTFHRIRQINSENFEMSYAN